jgi:hypothetical protein
VFCFWTECSRKPRGRCAEVSLPSRCIASTLFHCIAVGQPSLIDTFIAVGLPRNNNSVAAATTILLLSLEESWKSTNYSSSSLTNNNNSSS